jgi:hypothetical protein
MALYSNITTTTIIPMIQLPLMVMLLVLLPLLLKLI